MSRSLWHPEVAMPVQSRAQLCALYSHWNMSNRKSTKQSHR